MRVKGPRGGDAPGRRQAAEQGASDRPPRVRGQRRPRWTTRDRYVHRWVGLHLGTGYRVQGTGYRVAAGLDRKPRSLWTRRRQAGQRGFRLREGFVSERVSSLGIESRQRTWVMRSWMSLELIAKKRESGGRADVGGPSDSTTSSSGKLSTARSSTPSTYELR